MQNHTWLPDAADTLRCARCGTTRHVDDPEPLLCRAPMVQYAWVVPDVDGTNNVVICKNPELGVLILMSPDREHALTMAEHARMASNALKRRVVLHQFEARGEPLCSIDPDLIVAPPHH